MLQRCKPVQIISFALLIYCTSWNSEALTTCWRLQIHLARLTIQVWIKRIESESWISAGSELRPPSRSQHLFLQDVPWFRSSYGGKYASECYHFGCFGVKLQRASWKKHKNMSPCAFVNVWHRWCLDSKKRTVCNLQELCKKKQKKIIVFHCALQEHFLSSASCLI